MSHLLFLDTFILRHHLGPGLVVGVDGEGVGDPEVPGDGRPLAGDGRGGAHRAGPLREGDRDGATVALVTALDDDTGGDSREKFQLEFWLELPLTVQRLSARMDIFHISK